jgi:hypothetical protein
VLHTRERLQKAVNALSHKDRQHKLSWIRGITFGAPPGSTSIRDQLSYPLHGNLESVVVMYAAGISELEIVSDGAAPNGILVCAALVASRTLRHLDLRLEASSLPGLLISCIGSFPQLRDLKICITGSRRPRLEQVDIVPLDAAHDWALPALTSLHLSVEDTTETHYSSRIFTSFMTCALDSLTDLTIDLIRVTPDVFALRGFLRSLPRLTFCHLHATTTVIDEMIPDIHSQDVFLMALPSEQGLRALHHTTRTLEIVEMFRVDDPKLETLFKLMEVLEQRDRSRMRLIQVKLLISFRRLDEMDRIAITFFLWTSQAVAYLPTSFLDRMRRYALRLKRSGILLLDCEGHPNEIEANSEGPHEV